MPILTAKDILFKQCDKMFVDLFKGVTHVRNYSHQDATTGTSDDKREKIRGITYSRTATYAGIAR
jgi:hypothetical protein